MKHEDFIKNNSAEKYVLGKLSDKDGLLFEEHMLFCDICTDEVKKLYKTQGDLEVASLIPTESDILHSKQNDKKLISFGFYLKIAAGIAILTTFLWFIAWYIGSNKQKENLASHIKEIKPVEKTVPNKIDTVQPKNLIAENSNKESFVQLERFESQMKQEYRSESVTDIVPSNDKNFKTTDIVKFKWKKQDIEKLTITIYNNKGKIISQKELTVDVFSQKIKLPGLYYWQLETDEDIVYTGKFKVK